MGVEGKSMEAVKVCYKREYKHIPTNTSRELRWIRPFNLE